MLTGENLKRSSDRELIDRFENKIKGILNFLKAFENEDGLLEKLQGWVFVEWSQANKLVQDVNYPTNMFYSAALAAASRLYGYEEYKIKSQKVKEKVLEQSYDGKFFVDNAVRTEDGKFKLSGLSTEVCQYYAYFLGIANKDTHSELLKNLINDFGPNRDLKTTWSEIFPANCGNI